MHMSATFFTNTQPMNKYVSGVGCTVTQDWVFFNFYAFLANVTSKQISFQADITEGVVIRTVLSRAHIEVAVVAAVVAAVAVVVAVI